MYFVSVIALTVVVFTFPPKSLLSLMPIGISTLNDTGKHKMGRYSGGGRTHNNIPGSLYSHALYEFQLRIQLVYLLPYIPHEY